MKPTTKKIISISILILIVALFIYYIKNHISDFSQIKLINPFWLIPLILLFLLSYYFTGLQTKHLLIPLGIKLKGFEAFAISIITGFYNIITPTHGGMVIRALYLKKKHGFSYTNFLSSLTGIYVINFLIGALLGLISLIFIYINYNIFNRVILLVFLGFLIPTLFITIFSPKFKETKYNLINKIIRVANGWHLIKNNKKVILIAIITTIGTLLTSIISTMIAYHIFGIELSFIKALFLASIGFLSIIISITPGNLGIAEAIAVFSALIIGITPAQSLSVAILGRIVQMMVMFTSGPIFSYILLKHKPKHL